MSYEVTKPGSVYLDSFFLVFCDVQQCDLFVCMFVFCMLLFLIYLISILIIYFHYGRPA